MEINDIIQPEIILIGVAGGALVYITPFIISWGIRAILKLR